MGYWKSDKLTVMADEQTGMRWAASGRRMRGAILTSAKDLVGLQLKMLSEWHSRATQLLVPNLVKNMAVQS